MSWPRAFFRNGNSFSEVLDGLEVGRADEDLDVANDEIPTDAEFEKSIGDYLTFEFSMVMQNREYLFAEDKKNGK